MTPIKAIIVDDERLARVSLRSLLDPFPEIQIVGEANSCKAAIELVQQNKPKLIFLDLNMPVMGGWEFLDSFTKDDYRDHFKDCKVIVLFACLQLSERRWSA